MKIKGYFTRLISAILANLNKRPSAAQIGSFKRNLLKDEVLIIDAQFAGARRLAEAHRAACLGGYRAKIMRVQAGKGSNSIRGIPHDITAGLGIK